MGTRPPFDQALAHWRRLLAARGLPPAIRWAFREHLCLHYPVPGGGFAASFQTMDPPVSEDDVRLVYDAATVQRLAVVFAVVARTPEYSLCTLLGDTWGTDEDVSVPDWELYFYRDGLCRTEEVTDLREWRRRKRRESRALSGLDYVYVLSIFKGRPGQGHPS